MQLQEENLVFDFGDNSFQIDLIEAEMMLEDIKVQAEGDDRAQVILPRVVESLQTKCQITLTTAQAYKFSLMVKEAYNQFKKKLDDELKLVTTTTSTLSPEKCPTEKSSSSGQIFQDLEHLRNLHSVESVAN